MNKFAAIDQRGNILYTATMADDNSFKNGEVTTSGHTMIAVPIESDDMDMIQNHWYNGTAVVRKLESAASLQGNQLIDLPIPCSIQINSEVYACDDGTADLDFTYPGIYNVTVVANGYFDKQFEIVIP